MDKIIKWGVLGFARIARLSVIPAILKAPNAEFYAIASRDTDKTLDCQKQFGCKMIYDSYEALLDDPEIDAVYIPLPNKLHKEWTVKAACKGKHVLCEKPISLNKQECEEMIEACNTNNVKFMEGFMYRFSNRTKKVKEILDSNILGEVKYINSTFRFLLNRPGDVRLKPELGGGSLYDVGCYPVNFVGMVTGCEPVSMSSERIMKDGIDVGFSAVLKYENGILASINSGFDTYKLSHSIVSGTKGSMHVPDTFSDEPGKITVTTENDTNEYDIEPGNRYEAEIEDFSAAIINNREPGFSLQETLRNIGIIESLLESNK